MDFKTNNKNYVKEKMKKYNKYNIFNMMYILSIFQTEFLYNFRNIEYLTNHPYTYPWVHEDIAMYKLLNTSEGYVNLTSLEEITKFSRLVWNEDSGSAIFDSVKKYASNSLNRLLPSLVEKQMGYRFYFEHFLVKSFYMLNNNELIIDEFKKVFNTDYYSFFKVVVQYYYSLIKLHIDFEGKESQQRISVSEFFKRFKEINDDLMKNLPFLDKLTFDIEDYRDKQFKLLEKTNWDYYNCFNYLRCKPIIKIDEFIVCPLPLTLVKAFVFYIYNEFTFGSDERRTLLGDEYEKYIYTIMKNTLNEGIVYSEIPYLGKKSSDVILVSNDQILFIECKFKSIPFDYRDIENFTKKEKLIVQYADALNQIIMNFRDTLFNRIPKLPMNASPSNMYGIILIQEMAIIPKVEIVQYCIEKNKITNFEKEFIMKHVHFVDDEFFEEYVLNENIDFFKILYSYTQNENPNDVLKLSAPHKNGITWSDMEADKIFKKMFSE